MPHAGKRDGPQFEGKWRRRVILTNTECSRLTEGSEAGPSQDDLVEAFFQGLVAALGPEARRLPPKIALGEALAYHAALWLAAHPEHLPEKWD